MTMPRELHLAPIGTSVKYVPCKINGGEYTRLILSTGLQAVDYWGEDYCLLKIGAKVLSYLCNIGTIVEIEHIQHRDASTVVTIRWDRPNSREYSDILLSEFNLYRILTF